MVDKIIAKEIIVGSTEGQHVRLAPDGIRLQRSLINPLAWLTVEHDHPNLYFFDAHAKERVRLLIENDGTPQLMFLDANGAPRLMCLLETDGTPVIELYNALGQTRLTYRLDPDDNTPVIQWFDKNEKKCFEMGLDRQDEMSFQTLNEKGYWEDWTPRKRE